MPEECERVPGPLDGAIRISLEGGKSRLTGAQHAHVGGARMCTQQAISLLEVSPGIFGARASVSVSSVAFSRAIALRM
jgi:hypothetical protein